MQARQVALTAVVIVVLIAAVAAYVLIARKGAEAPREKGAVQTAKEASKSVPEIQTNPGQKVPEINPLDRANPFKYTNPLR